MAVAYFQNVGPLGNNVYVVYDAASKDALIVDPSFQSEPVRDFLSQEGLHLQYIVNTHGHVDHIWNNRFFKTALPEARLLIHPDDRQMLEELAHSAKRFGLESEPSPPADALLEEGQTISVGAVELRVLHTPGHTRGGCSFVLDGAVITGDTLFCNTIGRSDLPGGSQPQLLESIRTKLLPLPADTIVYPGHGDFTTIGEEAEHNPFLQREARRRLGGL